MSEPHRSNKELELRMAEEKRQTQNEMIFRLEAFIFVMFVVIGAIHRLAGAMAFLASPIILVAGILRSILQQIVPVWQEQARPVGRLVILNILLGIFGIVLGFLLTGLVLLLTFQTPLLHN